MNEDNSKYESWLTTIANTRLLFNRMEELEYLFDTRTIRSNGVKRCFNTPQRMRAAFRDLMVEALEQTDYTILLDVLMEKYKKAWAFYKDNLSRRSGSDTLPIDLLNYIYSPNMGDTVSKKRQDIFDKAQSQDVDIRLLFLIMTKALPGYDSKEGDPVDFAVKYEKVMQLLTEFTGTGLYEVLPIITKARAEERKTRLMLIYYVYCILDVYCSYATNLGRYQLSKNLKESLVDLQLEGYWNECGGSSQLTHYWHFQPAESQGTFFVTHWEKDAEDHLKGIRYTFFCINNDDGILHFYLTHPENMKHRIEGRPYTDMDHAWYSMPKPENQRPDHLPLHRLLPSAVWPHEINLTKVTDDKVLSLYQRWHDKQCEVLQMYSDCEYRFFLNLYAVTTTHLYICSENEGEYYKVPREANEAFGSIQIGDNVGTLLMNGQVYLAFDDSLLYIPTTAPELRKYGIERVTQIE